MSDSYYLKLALKAHSDKKIEEAKVFYKKVILINPKNATALGWLGSIEALQKNFFMAEKYLHEALKIEKNNLSFLLNYANILFEIKKFHEAEKYYTKIVRQEPLNPYVYLNLAACYNEQDQFLTGLINSEKAIELKPEYAEAWNNRGSALCGLERFEEAIAHFDQALRLNPDLSDSALNKSILLFLREDYKNAFDLYEARWKSTGFGSPPLQSIKPRWTGERNIGRLLIWAEQGIGDQILYGSMLNELRNFPQKKIISVTKKLIPLFQRSFPDYQIVDKKEVLSDELYDEHVPIGSIGKFLREDVDSFKKATYPYLVNNLSQTQQIKLLPQFKGKKVCGIAWRSSNKKVGRDKSISLIDLLPILSNYDMQYVNLQYGDTTEDVENLKKIYQPALYAVPEIDTFDDIDGVVSIMSACDLIITTSNTTAHLAGALNKETLLLIPRNIGKFWYWQGIEGVSLWYPSIRIFQQQKQGDWAAPINEIRTHLDKINNKKRD